MTGLDRSCRHGVGRLEAWHDLVGGEDLDVEIAVASPRAHNSPS